MLERFISRCNRLLLENEREFMVKRLKVICVQTINGEKHYIVQSPENHANSVTSEDFDEAKIRKEMKEEASRPLLLLRAE
jgi:hypothetical protein